MNRRDVLKGAAVPWMMATLPHAGSAAAAAPAGSAARVQRPAKGCALHVQSVVRREDTAVWHEGDGRGLAMSWAADGRQLVAVCDGTGWPTSPKEGYFSSRLF